MSLMKTTPVNPLGSLLGLFLLTACAAATPSAMAPAPQPTPTEAGVLPASSSPGASITWQGLQVTMEQAEITQDFTTEYGSTRSPSPGQQFLWVRVRLNNSGPNQVDTPPAEHFGVLYAALEFKPTYGHRLDHADYTALEPILFPDQEVVAWLRFEIPANAGLADLRFVFLPESSQVGVLFSSPTYPYSESHPTFVWECAP